MTPFPVREIFGAARRMEPEVSLPVPVVSPLPWSVIDSRASSSMITLLPLLPPAPMLAGTAPSRLAFSRVMRSAASSMRPSIGLFPWLATSSVVPSRTRSFGCEFSPGGVVVESPTAIRILPPAPLGSAVPSLRSITEASNRLAERWADSPAASPMSPAFPEPLARLLASIPLVSSRLPASISSSPAFPAPREKVSNREFRSTTSRPPLRRMPPAGASPSLAAQSRDWPAPSVSPRISRSRRASRRIAATPEEVRPPARRIPASISTSPPARCSSWPFGTMSTLASSESGPALPVPANPNAVGEATLSRGGSAPNVLGKLSPLSNSRESAAAPWKEAATSRRALGPKKTPLGFRK